MKQQTGATRQWRALRSATCFDSFPRGYVAHALRLSGHHAPAMERIELKTALAAVCARLAASGKSGGPLADRTPSELAKYEPALLPDNVVPIRPR